MTRRTKQHQRLDEAMERQRLALGLEWREVADRAGVSYETLRALRRTGTANPLTKRRVEDAFGWAPGSIDAILDGGEPVKADAEKTSERTPRQKSRARARRVRELQEEIQRRIDELQEQLDELRRMTEDEDTRGEDEDYRRAIG